MPIFTHVMIEPSQNESMESLKAREAVESAVLAHADDWDASDAAQEIRGACQRLPDEDSEPRTNDSSLTVSILSVSTLAVDVGGDSDEVTDELERIADTLEEGGWGSLRAVAAL